MIENPAKALLLFVGIAMLAAGLLFAAQGAGLVHWPASSFMLDQRRWIYYGAGIAAAGVVLMFLARR
jgi:bacteriorhodopsin